MRQYKVFKSTIRLYGKEVRLVMAARRLKEVAKQMNQKMPVIEKHWEKSHDENHCAAALESPGRILGSLDDVRFYPIGVIEATLKEVAEQKLKGGAAGPGASPSQGEPPTRVATASPPTEPES